MLEFPPLVPSNVECLPPHWKGPLFFFGIPTFSPTLVLHKLSCLGALSDLLTKRFWKITLCLSLYTTTVDLKSPN